MPTLTADPTGQKFIWEGTFADRLIPKEAKFRWNPTQKVWWTDDHVKAHHLLKYAADGRTVNLIKAGATDRIESARASRAVDADTVLPCPAGLAYRPFQKAGIAYALSRNNILIADEMGLGKTIQAIGVINADPNLERILIVCPSGLRLNWRNELKTWLTRGLTVGIMEGKDKALPNTNITIISYGILNRKKALLKAAPWCMLVVDESHYLKNDTAQRTKAILNYWDRRAKKAVKGVEATRKIFLTGTPMVNRPKELWTQYNNLAPELFKSFMYFMKRYCGAYQDTFGWNFDGSSNLDELNQKAREHFMIRRLKKDVLTELPPKVRQIIELPQDGAFHVVNRDRKTLADYEASVAALEDAGDIAFEEMAEIRHETAVAKVPAAIKHIESCLEDGRKVIVFAHHHDVIDPIMDHFGYKAVSITGKTSPVSRELAVEAFQTETEVKLFVGNIQAAGVGITLTAASHVIFCELDWTPGWVNQAEDRAHRMGQHDSVLVQHLVFGGTIDARMAELIVAKQAVSDAALDDEVAGPDIENAEVEVNKIKAKEAAKARKAQKEAKALTRESVFQIMKNLRLLASVCDGAVEKDGQGFNGVDSPFGHALADRDFLTEKQALTARKMLTKYKKQLGEAAVYKMYE